MRPKVDLRQAMARVERKMAVEMTFCELVEAYCAAQFDGADMRLRKWVDCFGDESAWSITSTQLSLAAEALLQSGLYKPSSINRDTSTIGTVYRWAIRRHLAPLGFTSPTVAIQRYDEDIRRVELSAQEVQRLLAAAKAERDRRFAVYVRLLLETGGRRGEIRERRWADVDLDSRTITVMETKTDRPRQLFFSEETAQLIRRIWPKRDPADLLFEGRRKGHPINYRMAWERLTETIGRPDLHQHDLRHHRAAELLKAGTTIAVAAQVLGHSSLILQRRYGHLESATLRAATEASWR
jgi:integrase